jgi:hypothetical protein
LVVRPEVKLVISEVIKAVVPTVREYALASVYEKNNAKRDMLTSELMDKKIGVIQEMRVPTIIESPRPSPEVRKEKECPTCKQIEKLVAKANPKAVMGRTIWKTLHTTAEIYPENPSEDIKERVKTFIESTIMNMPCKECAEHGMKLLEENQLDYSSGPALRRSLCEFHNRVNASLGKDIYPCE